MEQTVTCFSEISHKPLQDKNTWHKRRLDPSFPFPLFLPLSGLSLVLVKEGWMLVANTCHRINTSCVSTALLFQPLLGAPSQLWPGSAPCSTPHVSAYRLVPVPLLYMYTQVLPAVSKRKTAPRHRALGRMENIPNTQYNNPQPGGSQT